MLRHRRRNAASLALAAAAALAAADPAAAAPNNWENAAGGATATGTNWSLDRAPQSGDDATFDLSSNGYTTSLGSNLTSTKLRVGDDNVTLNFTNSRVWTLDFDPQVNSGSALVLGLASGDDARLTIKGTNATGFVRGVGNGQTVVIGSAAGSTGSLSLQEGGNIDFDGAITVGGNGRGSLNINGGTAATGSAVLGNTTAAANSSVSLAGASSFWDVTGNLTLGGSSGGNGTVAVSGDADLTVSGATLVRAGSTFTLANGSGANSTFTTGALSDASAGAFTWTSGSIKVTNSTLKVGAGSLLGNVTLNAARSLEVAQELQINPGAGSTLTLSGGALKANTIRVNGQLASAAANALVTAPAVINNGTISGSVRLTGTLNNAAGASVVAPASGTVQIDGLTTNAGSFDAAPVTRFNGGLNNSGTLLADVATGTQIFGNINNLAAGRINVNGSSSGVFTATFEGNVDNDGVIRIEDDALFKGIVTGAGDYSAGGTAVFENTYSPDALADAEDFIFFAGNLTTRGPLGRILIEIGGTQAGLQYDNINVGGAATLSKVDVVLKNGFTPALGDEFVLVSTVGGINYTGGAREDVVNLPALPGDLSWEFCSDSPNCLTVTVVPEPATLSLLGLGALALTGRRRRK